MKNSYNRNLLNNNNLNPAQFSKVIKNIYPSKSDKSGSPVSMQTDDGIITSKLKITNAFGKYFTNIARVLRASLNLLGDSVSEMVLLGSRTVEQPIFCFQPVCSTEVLNALKNLKRSKAAGLDNISSGMLKDASYNIAEPLSYIINLSLSSGIFPSDWKQAKVIPIFKSGNTTLMDNYRPIYILSVTSKILERIAHNQLYNFLERNKLLSPFQFGFRKKHSTTLAATYLTDDISKAMDKGKLTGTVFVDLRKAFDTLDHTRLIEKMQNLVVGDEHLIWFKDYLTHRSQTAVYDNYKSEEFPVHYGVPQGSILGPLLFWYISMTCRIF